MAEYIDQAIKLAKLDALDNNRSLTVITDKTGLRLSQLALALIVFLTVVLFIAEASTFIVGIACFLVPAYFSFLSLETHNKDDDIKYLTYWVIFALTEVISPLFHWLLGGFVYTFIRVGVTVACLHPQVDLSRKFYFNVISPYLTKNEATIDRKFNDIQQKGRDKFDEIAERGRREVEDLFKKSE